MLLHLVHWRSYLLMLLMLGALELQSDSDYLHLDRRRNSPIGERGLAASSGLLAQVHVLFFAGL